MGISFSNALGATASYEVVSKTLDNLNDYGASSTYAPTDKQTFGAAVVSKTLDYMNSGPGSSMTKDMSQTYGFSKDVLGAYASGIGSLTDLNV